MADVTRFLSAIERGDARAADDLLPIVYEELRRLAASRLAREPSGQTLQATALVHEAYLRLVGPGGPEFDGRGHFFAAAAESMRRILVERARRRGRAKHGGGRRRFELDEADLVGEPRSQELLALDEALDGLAREDRIKADLVKLRYFAGLTVEQAAEVLGISRATADRYWTYARAWLYHEIRGDEGADRGGASEGASGGAAGVG
jgi:RNA polymerase sigma factor (TIGR02999 family)